MPAGSGEVAVLRAELESVRRELDDLQEARRAFDDALYGKEPNDKNAVECRLTSLERDRNYARWLIGLFGGIGVAFLRKYIPGIGSDG